MFEKTTDGGADLIETTDRTRINAATVHDTLSRAILADGYSLVWDHRNSTGSYLADSRTGRRYLDLFSFFASAPIGHNHPAMRDPEFRDKLADVAAINPANPEVYTEEYAEFVQTFAHHAAPDYLPHLFFVAGGAPAVENALKVAFDWKVRKNLAAGKGEKGQQIIHFENAFHGRLGYTLSLTNTADPRKYMYYPKFEWPRVSSPAIRFPLTDDTLAEVEEAEARSIAQIEAAFDQHPDDIAAIIIEPIQAEGGDRHFRPAFLQKLRDICDAREAMLIFDEVQTGLGLTGSMWLHQQLGVKPDIIAFGKKVQVCGIAVSRRVDEVERNVFVESSRINSTWGGNLVDMVRATRYIEIIRDENLVENAAQQGAYLLDQLQVLEADGAGISNVRGRGLMIAFDLPDHASRDTALNALYDAGVLMLPCGTHSIRVRPYLDVTRAVLDEGLSVLETVLPKR